MSDELHAGDLPEDRALLVRLHGHVDPLVWTVPEDNAYEIAKRLTTPGGEVTMHSDAPNREEATHRLRAADVAEVRVERLP